MPGKRRVMRAARVDLIEEEILSRQNITLEEICREFDISMSTARRDLDEIIKRGKVEKVYGGVKAISTQPERKPLLSFEERDIVNLEEKKYIGRQAAALISPGDVIFIDTGSTCVHILESIGSTPCTVITNSLWVALKASYCEKVELIITPGRLNRKTGSFTGHDVLPYLESINIKMAFMAATGVSARYGCTNASEDEYIIKRTVCRNVYRIYLLVDHDKINKVSMYTYADMSMLSGIITDSEPEKEFTEYCKEKDITLIF